mmetsp:Transcript_87024/g.227175  ORF Transcript_87024/g.227175 Transcript_87024/m.227175 type:complete len:280 (-) Transcript_87024:56-895(-)
MVFPICPAAVQSATLFALNPLFHLEMHGLRATVLLRGLLAETAPDIPHILQAPLALSELPLLQRHRHRFMCRVNLLPQHIFGCRFVPLPLRTVVGQKLVKSPLLGLDSVRVEDLLAPSDVEALEKPEFGAAEEFVHSLLGRCGLLLGAPHGLHEHLPRLQNGGEQPLLRAPLPLREDDLQVLSRALVHGLDLRHARGDLALSIVQGLGQFLLFLLRKVLAHAVGFPLSRGKQRRVLPVAEASVPQGLGLALDPLEARLVDRLGTSLETLFVRRVVAPTS